MDPYGILGLAPGASQAEVKRAYRRLAKELHPDAAGESALPRFLELQDAYELLTGTRIRTVRAPGSSAAGARGSGGGEASARTEGFRGPWRADPARARAAREQARTRRPWPGGQPSWTTGGGAAARGGAAAGATGSGGSRSPDGTARPSGEGRKRRPAAGSDAGSDTGTTGGAGSAHSSGAGNEAGPSGSRSERRRRASRKATLGSTSYDEARDASDRSWAGASWYGPTTGEYWIVNPREYADPRKHGPGYSSRGRLEQASSGPAVAPDVGAPDAGTQGAATAEVAPSGTPARSDRPPATPSPAAPAPPKPTAGSGAPEAPTDSWPAVPRRRVGLALLAWPPLGLAAAAAIGQATGCSSYSTSCDGADRMLPWVAQAILLALLLASPWLARSLAGGSIGALIALVPGVGIITALGGARSAEGPPVLAGWLALAWLAGVIVAARRGIGRPEEPIEGAG